jgi:hypothetical protein
VGLLAPLARAADLAARFHDVVPAQDRVALCASLRSIHAETFKAFPPPAEQSTTSSHKSVNEARIGSVDHQNRGCESASGLRSTSLPPRLIVNVGDHVSAHQLGAADAVEPVAEQFPEPVAVTIGRLRLTPLQTTQFANRTKVRLSKSDNTR